MQEACNCFTICIRRSKSALCESCVERRACAEHIFVYLGIGICKKADSFAVFGAAQKNEICEDLWYNTNAS